MSKSNYERFLGWIRGQGSSRSSGDSDASAQELSAVAIMVSYEKILKLVHAYEPPPAGFDPMSATNEALEELGLPERPNAQTESEHFRFWEMMVGGSTQFIRPEFPTKGDQVRRYALHRNGPGAKRDATAAPMRGFDHRQDSRNWSGAYITPLRPNRFVHMTGRWSVPAPAVPHELPGGANHDNEEFRSSTWIGIDGHRPYPNASLPQIGTSQHATVDDGQVTEKYGAWWQWWVKGRPEHHVPVPIVNFQVAFGDEMLASLTVKSSGDVLFHLKNQQTKLFVAFKVTAPQDIVPLGSTAEWIHERPTLLNSHRMYPLPRCTDVDFAFCLARSAPTGGTPKTTQCLDNARLIRMFEIFEDPHRIAFVSQPAKTGNSAARVVYREAGA